MMSLEIIDKIILSLADKLDSRGLGDPYFKSPPYRIFPIKGENFRPITEPTSRRKLAFIDGGSREIFGAPDFSIQINRVYFNVFNGGDAPQASESGRCEYFSVTYAQPNGPSIDYETVHYPSSGETRIPLPDETDLKFSSADKTMSTAGQRADISRVAGTSRMFAEWKCAKHVAEEKLGEGSIVVMDGNLRAWYTNEARYAQSAYAAAEAKGAVVTGLSKTSRLLTTKSRSLLSSVEEFARKNVPHGTWYTPVAEVAAPYHNATIFIVKLHPNADHIFRFEIVHDQYVNLKEAEVDDILSHLAQNSCDLAFPGYPYGLIDADNFARVSEEEANGYKLMFLSQMTRNGRLDSFSSIRALDAHDILNRLVGY